MKKNKLWMVFLLVIILGITGCTVQLKGPDGKVVKNNETAQVLTKNIFCAPTNKEILNLYRENSIKLKEKYDKDFADREITKKDYDAKVKGIVNVDDLPACKDFTITTGGYEGIWESIFVKPLVWLLVTLGDILGNYGLSIIFVTMLIRLVMYPITLKTARQSENMKKAKPELEKLEKKYKDKNDQETMMKKSQEMMQVYKKFNINPLSGCIFGFIQIPLFFAFYEALFRLPVLMEDILLGFNMAVAPWKGFQLGSPVYLILPVLVLAATFTSFRFNSAMSSMGGSQEKQMKIMMNVMMVMIFFMSFQMSTGIILYWITNNAFTIIQNLIVKRSSK